MDQAKSDGTKSLTRTIGLSEAAEILHMHRETVREQAAAGIIPGAKPGREWVFLEEDLIQYLRSLYRSADFVPASVHRPKTVATRTYSQYLTAAEELNARLRERVPSGKKTKR